MNTLPKSVSRVIEAFERLPGVGPKTATRLAFYMLHMPEDEVVSFADRLTALKRNTVLCGVCKNVSEGDPCAICSSPAREHDTVCVVEQPTDVLSIERTGVFRGVYHVLHGVIDPLNNIGPDEIYLSNLVKRVSLGGVKEIVLALNPNMEGEATAMYLIRSLKAECPDETPRITRLAHGLPVGADIEYADEVTLKRALEGRRDF